MRRLVLLVVAVVLPSVAIGGETRLWDVSRRDAFSRGQEFENVILTSRGELKLGYTSDVVGVKEEPTFWCGLARADGSVLVGTGKGSIYQIAGGKAEKLWDTKEMLVTALVESNGVVYAATIPNGKVFTWESGVWKEFVTLPSKYVWALAAAPEGGVFAAAGAPGAIYRIEKGGQATPLFAPGKDSSLKCENVLSLRVEGDALLAGTSAPGHLVRIQGKRVHVLHDFGDGEVRSITALDDSWYVAVNSGVKVAPSEFLNAVEKAQQGKDDVQPKEPAAASTASSMVWRISAARTERVLEFATSYITEIMGAEDGIYIGTNNSGRIFRLLSSGDHELLFDFPEGQVLGFVPSGRAVRGAVMGNRAALRRFTGERAKRGVYVSDVLDAKFSTMWGTLTRAGHGAVSVQTRSGNIAKAGDGWSEWSNPITTNVGKVESPKGRYLQFRVSIESDASVVTGITVAYKNENQRPRVRDLKVEVVPAPQGGGFAPMSGERGPSPRLGEGHSMLKKIQWRVEDDDGDYLVSRLYYRPVDGTGTWLPILSRESTPQVEYVWNTENIPDGRYVVRVACSDEHANAKEEALVGEAETDPLVIDNGKPEIDVVISGGKATGVATDRISNITRIEYTINAGEWQATLPRDRLFDDRREEFEFDVPRLGTGVHTLVVRALDQESNVGTISKTFEMK